MQNKKTLSDSDWLELEKQTTKAQMEETIRVLGEKDWSVLGAITAYLKKKLNFNLVYFLYGIVTKPTNNQ